MLFTKIKFHLSNICELFSRIRCAINENIRAKNSKLCYYNYRPGFCKQALEVPQTYHDFRQIPGQIIALRSFFASKSNFIKINSIVLLRSL